MKKYVKPKNEFADGINFHDSKIKSMKISGKNLVIELENNHIVEKNGKYTDNCKVTFHNFDGDEFVSTFRVFRKKKYNEYKVGKLIEWLKNGKIENNQIIHTFYNYSVIFFTGCFYSDGKWKSFELMLSYSGDMVVEYELDKE